MDVHPKLAAFILLRKMVKFWIKPNGNSKIIIFELPYPAFLPDDVEDEDLLIKGLDSYNMIGRSGKRHQLIPSLIEQAMAQIGISSVWNHGVIYRCR